MHHYVFVIDANKKPLSPCHPAVARKLLDTHNAAVYRRFPFTIILKNAKPTGALAPVRFKVDPGSKTTGLALQQGEKIVWAAEITHRGQRIKAALDARRAIRRSRRQRKTRYRQPRFDNRTRPAGWLPPSLQSRVDNIQTWLGRLSRLVPLRSISLELARFDMQLMQHAEISGVEYQQGELQGYEVREYLLEKWNRRCAYCGATNVPLEVEHIIPRSRGGSDRVSNLTLACEPCNDTKGSQTAAEFGYPEVQAQAKQPLKDAAAVNAARWATLTVLTAPGLPVEVGTGGRTKFNRVRQTYPKAHWIDAACVGMSGATVLLCPDAKVLQITAVGRQSRQMCRTDKYGFPRTGAKASRVVKGFQTGDIVQAVVPSGKKQGRHLGRVAVRATGSLNVGGLQGICWKYCQVVHSSDGYSYATGNVLRQEKQGLKQESPSYPKA